MEVLKSRLSRHWRTGFALPFSMVLTVIIAMMVGAAAKYCTETMRTSDMYLMRTRARLAAQSAIERTKMEIASKCEGQLLKIPDATSMSYGADLTMILPSVTSSLDLQNYFDDLKEANPGLRLYLGTKAAGKGVTCLWVTAEITRGSQTAAVTVQEDIAIPLGESADIFLYAYFANGDGHLLSRYLTVNGDVRSNKDFYITGAEINGYIYAAGKVDIAKDTDRKFWFWYDEKDVEMCTADSYNKTYRRESYTTENKYAKVRPTNPLGNGEVWIGGYEAPEGTKSGGRSTRPFWWPRSWPWSGGTTPVTVSDKVPITETLKVVSTQEDGQTQEKLVVNPKSGVLKMPQITSKEDLKQYKTYSSTAKTPKGRTGGTLICPNAYYDKDGKICQLSAKARLQEGPPPPDPDEPIPDVEETVESRSEAVAYFPAGSIPIYNCLEADKYAALLASGKIRASEWCRLKENGADNGPGEFRDGRKNYNKALLLTKHDEGETVDANLFTDDKGLFFSTSNYTATLDFLAKSNGVEFAEKARKLIEETDRWEYCKDETEKKTVKKGQKVVKTQSIFVYAWKKNTSGGYYSSWERVPAGYYSTSQGAEKIWTSPVTSVQIEGSYLKKSDVTSVASAFASYNYESTGIKATDTVFTSFGSGWSACTANSGKSYYDFGWYYSDDDSRYRRGYMVFQLVQHYEDGKPNWYEVVRTFSQTKDQGSARTKSEDYQVSQYSGIYHSAFPAGYLQFRVITNYVNQTAVKDVTYTFTPFEPKVPEEPVCTDLVDVKFIQLYKSRVSSSSPGREWSQVSYSGGISNARNYESAGSSYSNHLFSEPDLDKVVSALTKYEGVYESDVTGLFDRWKKYTTSRYSRTANVWYSSQDGYVAVELWEKTKGGVHLEYELRDRFVTSTEKNSIEQEQKDKANVAEWYYVPLHEYGTSQASAKWKAVDSSTSGYLDTSAQKTYKGRFVKQGDLEDIASSFDDKYKLDIDDVLNKFKSYGSGWSARPSGYGYGSGYYNTDDAGYLVIKIVEERDYWSRITGYRLEFAYADELGKGGHITPEEEPNVVPDGDIPVHEFASMVSSKEFKKWTRINYGTAYKNKNDSSQLVLPDELDEAIESVARATVAKNSSLKQDDIEEQLLERFEEAGWTLSKYVNGYYKTDPSWHITLTPNVVNFTVLETNANYVIKSVDAGQVTRTRKQDREEYLQQREEQWYSEHPPSVVTRELRRIFVKGGYKIDQTVDLPDPQVLEETVFQRLKEDHSKDVDDILKRGLGLTTEYVRPFRDDAVKCNENCPKGGDGVKYADDGAVILIGTWDFPIIIDGPVVFDSDVVIRGFVSGRGTIYSGRNIHIIGDINYKNPPYWPEDNSKEPETKGKDLLLLISKGSIVFGNYARRPTEGNPYADEMWQKILEGHYIDGRTNTSGELKGRKYTEKDYTLDYGESAEDDWYKIVYDKAAKKFTRAKAKRYESVLGDWIFISENNGTQPYLKDDGTEGALLHYGSDCRFSQHWDCNVRNITDERYRPFASYQSHVIEAYAQYMNWKDSDRVGAGRKTFNGVWNDSNYRTYCNNRYATTTTSTTKPSVNYIQEVNAVLYSSSGIFGVVGGRKTNIVINGAIIGQDEALLPFVRNRRRLWTTESEDLNMTINWDIRLNLKSTEARKNNEGEGSSGYEHPMSAESDSGSAKDPRVLHWMQVPNDHNPEYNATP